MKKEGEEEKEHKNCTMNGEETGGIRVSKTILLTEIIIHIHILASQIRKISDSAKINYLLIYKIRAGIYMHISAIILDFSTARRIF